MNDTHIYAGENLAVCGAEIGDPCPKCYSYSDLIRKSNPVYYSAAMTTPSGSVRCGTCRPAHMCPSVAAERARIAAAVEGLEVKDDTGDNWERGVVCSHIDGPCGWRSAVLAIVKNEENK